MPYAIRTRGSAPAAAMDLTEARYKTITQAYDRLILAERLCAKFSMLLENYKELEAECFRISLDSITSRNPTISVFRGYQRRFERCLLNLFSTTYGYEEFLKVRGENEDKWLRKATTDPRETAFGQPIAIAMKALRNYTQHADLPLAQAIQQNKNADEQVVAGYMPRIDPRKIDCKRVQEKTSAGMETLKDIAKDASLLQLIRRYMNVFSELNSSVQTATQSDVGRAVEVMSGLQHEFTSLRGIGLTVSLCAVEYQSDGTGEIRMVPILSREILEGIQTMRAVYRENLYLDRQYVSTEAKPRK